MSGKRKDLKHFTEVIDTKAMSNLLTDDIQILHIIIIIISHVHHRKNGPA